MKKKLCLIIWFAVITIVMPHPAQGYNVAVLAFLDPSNDLYRYIQGHTVLLDSYNVPFDILLPEDLTTDVLSHYDRLVIPTMWEHFYGDWVTPERSNAIVSYIENGGGVVATEAGWYSSVTPSFFPYPITIDAGVGIFGDVSIIDPTNFIVSDLETTQLMGYTDSLITSKDIAWKSIVKVDGEDAIVYCEYGSGFAVYSGYVFLNPTDLIYPDWYINAVASSYESSTVPIPGALWLFGSGLLGLIGLRRKMKS